MARLGATTPLPKAKAWRNPLVVGAVFPTFGGVFISNQERHGAGSFATACLADETMTARIIGGEQLF